MRKILLILALTSGVFSCDSDDNNCIPEQTTTRVLSDKTIQLNEESDSEKLSFEVIGGEKLVFLYEHSGKDCPDIIDDEWGEKLLFEINRDVENFELTDEELAEAKCIYQLYGAWAGDNVYKISDGTITGTFVSEGIWNVEVDITYTRSDDDEEFVLKFNREFRE